MYLLGWGSVSLFTIGLGCLMPCESLDGLSGNWDPLKGTRRLPRVDPSESGRDNFIGIRAVKFSKTFVLFSFQSPVDIGCMFVFV